jgi:tRNA A37 threonylcarbamoyladenosine biosynthesis protein TsaE
LKKEYTAIHPFFRKMIHIDAYRFDNPKEANVLKLKDDTDKNTLIVIEWPSKLGGTVDEDMTVAFSVVDDDTREISVNYSKDSLL